MVCELAIMPGLPIVYGQTVMDWLFQVFKPHLNRVVGVTYATRSLDRRTLNASHRLFVLLTTWNSFIDARKKVQPEWSNKVIRCIAE